MALERITTLLSAAETYDLVDLETVKEELGIPDSDTSHDGQLQRMIARVSSAISRYCNRTAAAQDEASFPIEEVTDLFYPERDAYPYQVPGGIQPLQLSHWPVINVTSVIVTDPPGFDTTLIADVDYVLDARRGTLIRLSQFTAYPTQWPPIKTLVQYSGGYADIPVDISSAALRWITQLWESRDRDPLLRSREQPGLGIETFWVGGPPSTGGIPSEIVSLLTPYRVPVTA